MPAIDRKCFDCKQTTSHGLVLRVYACLTGHAQRLNMLKERPRKWFFREEVDFLASLAFVVNCGHTIDLQQVQAKRFSFRVSVCPVSNSFFITPRIGTKFVSVDR